MWSMFSGNFLVGSNLELLKAINDFLSAIDGEIGATTKCLVEVASDTGVSVSGDFLPVDNLVFKVTNEFRSSPAIDANDSAVDD